MRVSNIHDVGYTIFFFLFFPSTHPNFQPFLPSRIPLERRSARRRHCHRRSVLKTTWLPGGSIYFSLLFFSPPPMRGCLYTYRTKKRKEKKSKGGNDVSGKKKARLCKKCFSNDDKKHYFKLEREER